MDHADIVMETKAWYPNNFQSITNTLVFITETMFIIKLKFNGFVILV